MFLLFQQPSLNYGWGSDHGTSSVEKKKGFFSNVLDRLICKILYQIIFLSSWCNMSSFVCKLINQINFYANCCTIWQKKRWLGTIDRFECKFFVPDHLFGKLCTRSSFMQIVNCCTRSFQGWAGIPVPLRHSRNFPHSCKLLLFYTITLLKRSEDGGLWNMSSQHLMTNSLQILESLVWSSTESFCWQVVVSDHPFCKLLRQIIFFSAILYTRSPLLQIILPNHFLYCQIV